MKQGVYKVNPLAVLVDGEHVLFLLRGEGMAPYVYDFAVSRRASRRLIFTSGQSVYIISPTFGLQRKAGEQFTKDRRFKLASGISRADFVFVALSEATLALVLL